MFHHRLDGDIRASVLAKWFLLAFLAGNVNAGGFLAAERFVTHVTGFATLFGIGVAEGSYDQAFGILTVPGFFLAGTMLSAYLIDTRFRAGRRPHYDWVMGLAGACLVAAALLGHYRLFGVFGEALRLRQDYVLLALLCLASGLQNAAITSASGATVRTTHLTGLTTDLGVGLVRVLGARERGKATALETRANWLRAGSIASFILGSVVGALLFIRVQYLGFLLPASIAFYAMVQAWREDPELLLPAIRRRLRTRRGDLPPAGA